jgi:hypothetical protein
LSADIEVGALTGPRLARPPRQVVLALMQDGVSAEYDVAELMTPQRANGGHDPSHAETCADFFRLTGPGGPRAYNLLQGHDVGVDRSQDLDDPSRADAAIHPAAAMDVVSGYPDIRHCRLTIADWRFTDCGLLIDDWH